MAIDIASVRALAAKAALNPAMWPETLWQVSQLIGGDMTLFEHIDQASGRVELGFTDRPEIVARTRAAYEEHFFAVNPRWEISRSMTIDAIVHDDLIGDDAVLGGYEYYVDFLTPSGLKYFIGSAAATDAEQTVILSIQRNADRGRVDDEGKRAFAAVLPDIRNAFATHLRMLQAPPGATLAALFDRLTDPLAVLGGDGRLAFANDAMLALLAAGDIVRLRNRELAGASESIARALGDAMRAALADGGSGMATAARPGSRHPLIFRIAPVAADDARPFGPTSDRLFCLLIDDPARPHWPSVEDAMRLFGLTRQEATVGTHLAAGRAANEIACRLGVSRNTVRSHVAMLRDKLGAHSALAVAAGMRRAVSPFA